MTIKRTTTAATAAPMTTLLPPADADPFVSEFTRVVVKSVLFAVVAVVALGVVEGEVRIAIGVVVAVGNVGEAAVVVLAVVSLDAAVVV